MGWVSSDWFECSECEGEGKVCRWCYHGHIVPASYKRRYPNDEPYNPEDNDGNLYECPNCKGSGGWTADEYSNRWAKNPTKGLT